MSRSLPAILLSVLALAPFADGAAAAPRRVVLAIDGSGSMKDTVGGVTLAGSLGGFIGKLSPDDELALIAFDARPALIRVPAPVGANPSAAVSQVESLLYDGQHSDLPAALAMACDAFPSAEGQPIDVILVTDGVVTVRAPRTAAAAIEEMNEKILPRCVAAGARIHVIGLGGERVNTAVLQSLAEASGGRAEFPLSGARLSGFLDGYLEATAPPPPPPPAREPRIAQPVAPPAAEEPEGLGRTALLLAGGSLLLAMIVGWFLLRRRGASGPAVDGAGQVTVREMASGREHQLKLPATIGRSPSSPIMVEDREASRRHLRLELQEGKLSVVDLGSSNGTFVNGVRLKDGEQRTVRPGDKLKIPGLEIMIQPLAMDADATYIRQDLDRTIVRPTQPER